MCWCSPRVREKIRYNFEARPPSAHFYALCQAIIPLHLNIKKIKSICLATSSYSQKLLWCCDLMTKFATSASLTPSFYPDSHSPPHRAVNKTHVDTPHAAWQRQQKLQARSSLSPALEIWPEPASPLSTRHRTQDAAQNKAERGIKRPKQQRALMPARQVQLAMAEISASESGIYVLRGGNFIMQWPTMKWAAVARNLCAKLRDSLSTRWLEEKGREGSLSRQVRVVVRVDKVASTSSNSW